MAKSPFEQRERRKGDTYLDYVQGNTRLGAQCVLVAPGAGEARHIELFEIHVRHLDLARYAVLLLDREARAQHDGVGEALEQLLRQACLVYPSVQALLQQLNQPAARVEDGPALLDGDAIRFVPRHLLEGADHALVGTLGRVLGERRLARCVSASYPQRTDCATKGRGHPLVYLHAWGSRRA